MAYIGKSKEQLRKITTEEIKKEVEHESWIALLQYLHEKGNGPEAKIAKDIVATLAREKQVANGAAQLQFMMERFVATKTVGALPDSARGPRA